MFSAESLEYTGDDVLFSQFWNMVTHRDTRYVVKVCTLSPFFYIGYTLRYGQDFLYILENRTGAYSESGLGDEGWWPVVRG